MDPSSCLVSECFRKVYFYLRMCVCVHVYVCMHATAWKWPQGSIGSLELELLGDPGNKLWSSAGAARAPNF